MQYERFIFVGVFVILCSGVLDLPLEMITQGILNKIFEIAELPLALLGV